MDEQDHPPGKRDVPRLAAGFRSAELEGCSQEEDGTFGGELGPTEIPVLPSSEDMILTDFSFGGLHLDTVSERGAPGVFEDVRAERGDNVPSGTLVGETSCPVNPERNRSRDFQEQDTAGNSSGFVGAADDPHTAEDSPRIAIYETTNCEEHRLASTSDFEQGVFRDCNEVTVACLDLNAEETLEEGTNLDRQHGASAGELDVREITEDASSILGRVVQDEEGLSDEGENRQGSQCAHTGAIEQLKLDNKKREHMVEIDSVGHTNAAEYSMQGKEMTASSKTSCVEGDRKMESSGIGYLENNFFAFPSSENVPVGDLNDELVASSSQVYLPFMSVVGNGLQNETYPPSTSFEPAAVQDCHHVLDFSSDRVTDSIDGQATSCDTLFVDTEEEMVEANPVDLLGEHVVRISDISTASGSGSILGWERISKEQQEKHGIQGNIASEDARPLMLNIESSEDSQLIPVLVMEVDTERQASEEEEEDVPLSRPSQKFLEGTSHLDGQAGCAMSVPGFSVSLCPAVADDVEGKSPSGGLHEDISRNIKQPASQPSEKHINHEITREQNFTQDIPRNIEQPASQLSEKHINQETMNEQNFTQEHDVVFHLEKHESAVELIGKKIDDQTSIQPPEGHTDKEEITREQAAAEEPGGNFHMLEDESTMELVDKQIDGRTLMQLAEDHIDGQILMQLAEDHIDGQTLMHLAEDHIYENVMNVQNDVEEHRGCCHMDEGVSALELADNQLADHASAQPSEHIDEEIAIEQNRAEEHGGRSHMEEDGLAVEPVDKQTDGQALMQASEEYVMEDMNEQKAADEHGGTFHVDEDEFALEVVDKQIDGQGSSQTSEEHLDEEMTEEQNTTDGQFGGLYMDKDESATELVNEQIDDEISMQPLENHNDAEATSGWNDAEEHGGDVRLEDGQSVLRLISDKQVGDQTSTGEKVVDEFDGALLEAEQSSMDVLKDEGCEETDMGKKTSEPGGGERVSDEVPIEEHSPEQLSKVSKERFKFGVGDLVWAKVKSHPWWPGQIFDPADASAFAKKVQKSGRVLVAFFGDCTFGWLQQSQMIAFRPNFEEKVKQTNMKAFCKAVAEALDEVCRRAELGTSCSCHVGGLHSAGTFPDANTGIQKGVRIKDHPDVLMSKAGFKSDKVLEFVKGVACSPFGSWSSSLEAAEIRGHVYSSRTGIHGMEKPDSDDLLQNVLTGLRDRAGRIFATPGQGLKLKRRFSSLETDSGMVAERGKEAKKINMGKDGMRKRPSSEGGRQLLTLRNSTQVNETNGTVALEENVLEGGEVQGSKEYREDTILGKGKRTSFTKRFESSKKARRLGSDGEAAESMAGERSADEKGSDDDAKTLFALAGFHSKLLKKLGKGNMREGGVKSSTDEKSGSNIMADSQELGQTQEVKPSKKIPEVDKTVKESSVGQVKVTGNSSLPAPAAPQVGRASELRTKFHNDVDPSLPEDAELLNDFIIVRAELNKKPLDNDIILKDQNNAKETSVTMSNFKNQQEVAVKGEKQPSVLHSKQGTGGEKLSKAMRLGECIQRIAGELTGTPPISKSVDQNSTKKAVFDVSMKSGLKKEMKGSIPDSFGPPKNQKSPVSMSVDEKTRHTSVQLLQGLHFLARNPLNNVNTIKPSGGVMVAFLKFRDMVFQKSSGYDAAVSRSGEQAVGKTDAHLDNNDHVSDPKSIALKSQPGTQDLAPSIQKHGVQELALAARKRKSEVVQEGLAKMSKKGVLMSTLQGQHAFKAGTSTGKFMEQSHKGKHQKHISSRATCPASDVKSPIRRSDDKLSSHAPVGLFMKFPQSFALPSEAQLKATFIRFGALQTDGTRVYRSNASAQVVFKHGRDAEMALKYAKENAIFGQAAVTFRLRYFSQPEKVDTKQNVSLFGKEKSVRGDGRISSPTIERLESLHHVTKPSSLDRGERGRTGSIAEFPVSHQLQTTENPSKSNMSLNLSSLIPNSVTTANESSGDIQDQMIKLLRQVSVIVSSTTEAS